MAVSSKTLFHFTRRYRTLVQILKDKGFWAQYTIEPRWDIEEVVIPMVCFCDIPLTSIAEHAKRYGSYAIGLSKEKWEKVIDEEVSPVFYVKKEFMSELLKIKKRKKESLPYQIDTHIKAFEGVDKKTKKTRTFYDEREWRYVWQTKGKREQTIIKPESEECLKALNEKSKDDKLGFCLSDISYIIIKDETKRQDLIAQIDAIFSDVSDTPNRDLLKSKIISLKQIQEDF